MDGQTPTYFFDSMSDPSAINVPGDVVFLLEDDVFDDEIVGLSIPFQENQLLTIRYGQLGDGNGSRFEGVTVKVPEPGGFSLLIITGDVSFQEVGHYSNFRQSVPVGHPEPSEGSRPNLRRFLAALGMTSSEVGRK